MFVYSAFVVIGIKHAADLLAVNQTVLEGEFAVGRPNVSIGKDPQLHAHELGDINHFLFRDPDIAAPAAAGTAAGGAGGLVEGKGEIRAVSHQYTVICLRPKTDSRKYPAECALPNPFP